MEKRARNRMILIIIICIICALLCGFAIILVKNTKRPGSVKIDETSDDEEKPDDGDNGGGNGGDNGGEKQLLLEFVGSTDETFTIYGGTNSVYNDDLSEGMEVIVPAPTILEKEVGGEELVFQGWSLQEDAIYPEIFDGEYATVGATKKVYHPVYMVDCSALFTYIGDGEISFSGGEVPSNGVVLVPRQKDGNAVTKVGRISASNETDVSGIKVLVIPNGITELETAFPMFQDLEEVILPKSLEKVGVWTFVYCTKLASISIPNGVTSIGDLAFGMCTSLTTIEIPNSVTQIGGHAFSACSGLTSITLPNKLTVIEDGLFSGCVNLTSIDLSGGITQINEDAFRSCSSLTTIDIPSSVAQIGEEAFENCTSLISVEMPSALEIIDNYAFAGCISLTSIEIPSGVTEIGNRAFEGCTSLVSIVIPNSISNEGVGVFCDCAGLESVVFEENSQMTKIGNYYFSGCSNLTSVTLASEISVIGEYAFSGCESLASIEIPSGVAFIDGYAFENCRSLVTIEMPNGVKNLGIGAFAGCSSLTSFTIPSLVTSLNSDLFNGAGLTSITIPEQIVDIDAKAFANCSNLAVVYYNAINCGNGIFGISSNSYLFNNSGSEVLGGISAVVGENVTSIPNYLFQTSGPDSNHITSITFENNSNCVSIGEYAFDYAKLSQINIPSSVETIGGYAFNNCTNLTLIEIPQFINSIGGGAFANCSSLATVYFNATNCNSAGYYIFDQAGSEVAGGLNAVIGSNVTKIPAGLFATNNSNDNFVTSVTFESNSNCSFIGDSAFKNSLISSITIPSEVTNIGSGAFENCSSLVIVYFNATNCNDLSSTANVFYNSGSAVTGGLSAVIGSNVTKIPAYLFYTGNTNSNNYLTNVTFAPNSSCLSIGRNAFCYSKIVSLGIPSAISNIQYDAFASCSNLANVIFEPASSLTSIMGRAFKNCTSLTSISIPSSVTSIGEETFGGCSALASITLPFVGGSSTSDSASSSTLFGYIFGTSSYTGGTSTTQYYQSNGSLTYYIPTSLRTVTVTNARYLLFGAFYGCSNLTSISIFGSLTSIGVRVFSGCGSLESITLPFVGKSLTETTASASTLFGYVFSSESYTGSARVEQIFSTEYYMAYYIPTSLRTVTITNAISLLYGAFCRCSNIENIILPNTLTSIGDLAFYECSNLSSITIPNDVTSIGKLVFKDCSNLATVYYNATNCNDLSSSDILFYNSGSSVTGGLSVVIGSNVVRIPSYLFYAGDNTSYNYISSITFENNSSCTSIGDHAFHNCANLLAIELPRTVTVLGEYVFVNCRSLTSFTILNSVTSIGNSAFSGCSNLASVAFEANSSLVSVGTRAFGYCSALSSITLPSTVTALSGYIFEGCTSLISFTVLNSLSSIGDYAFIYCSNLASVTFEANSSLVSVGTSAFGYCSALSSITLPRTVTVLSDYMFLNCTSLTSFTILNSVTTIGDGAFNNCSNLASVTFEANSNCTSIGNSAFRDCENLTSIIIPNSVISIGGSVFRNCSALALITLSTSLSSIGYSAFSNCTALTKIFIPSSVTSISASNNKTNSPFYGCSNLTIYCEVASEPDGWGIYWNYLDDSNTITTYWGQTLSDYEAA